MNITVRPLEERDIKETVRAMAEAWNYSYETWERGYYPIEAHEFDLSQNTEENQRRYIGSQDSFCFVALADGKIAGRISGQIIGASGFGMIRNIAVHPDFHRKGVGQKLMDAAIGYFSEKGCHKVSLNTLPVLIPAINLYMKNGFVPEAYLAKQWWGVDFIFMSKWLQQK
ncbi:MAG: GNAT family N-acetyltransferase [Thermoplasmata archaeon]|nr:GNAT family N-acetyltransferase [Thermoplasmata archaeon]